jgi:hypothetical protein
MSISELIDAITARRDLPDDERIHALLLTGLEALGMTLAVVSRFQEQTYTVEHLHPSRAELTVPQLFDLVHTCCRRTLKQKGTLVLEDEASLGAYIGVPVMVAGRTYGTLNFLSRAAVSLDDADRRVVEQLADRIGRIIENQQVAATG